MNHRGTENTEKHRGALVGPDGTLCVPFGGTSARTDRKRSDSVRCPSGSRTSARDRQAVVNALKDPRRLR